MRNRTTDLLLVGISGYGDVYLDEILQAPDTGDEYRLTGVVDIQPERSRYYSELVKRNIPIHKTMESFFADSRADLTIISTPIHLHCEQTCYALEQGSHVLCEKPIAATVQEALQMKEARDQAEKFVAIGFNWCYEDQILRLKEDILAGTFGKPVRMKTIVLWSRNEQYFQRSRWAGRIKSDQGHWVLDSVAHNATSHYLHNMLFLLGPSYNESVQLRSVEAELYRANLIENFDTCAARIVTENDVEVLYYASHAVLESVGPRFCLEFEKATITYGYEAGSSDIKAVFADGTEKIYSGVGTSNHKLQDCLDWAKTGRTQVTCGIETALPQVICINGMQQSVPEIAEFPSEMVHRDEASGTVWVNGLYETMLERYEQGTLPSDSGVEWAKIGRKIDLRRYPEFHARI